MAFRPINASKCDCDEVNASRSPSLLWVDDAVGPRCNVDSFDSPVLSWRLLV